MSFPALNQAPSMDYSAVAVDPALQGSSPWGSSSPRADRSRYSRTESDISESPAPVSGHAHSRSQDSISANPFASEPGTPAISQQQPPSPEYQAALHQTQVASPAVFPPQDAGPLHHHRQQQQMRPGAARYHSARQQRPVPAYKLQAKVTALERTGRKDPVIRFDVYVRRVACLFLCKANNCRPIFPNFGPPSSAMSAVHIPNLSSSLSISSPPILKLSSLPFLLASHPLVLVPMKMRPESRDRYNGG